MGENRLAHATVRRAWSIIGRTPVAASGKPRAGQSRRGRPLARRVKRSMETGYVYSNGVRLYYEMIGQGEPLLLLNGGPGFPHDYLQQLQMLAPYACLVFFDQRGTGKSDKVDTQGYTIDANVEDVENLREALQLGPCGVLGHSWGGMLAQ